jgi:DNA-binding response OmpR family regulator
MNARILYVEANQDNCEFVVRDLTDYEITCAGAAEDALLLGRSGSFDLILLDEHLPGATGIELCQEIGAHDHVIAILILSGPDDEAMRKRAREAGAQDYWPTPVDLEAVGQEIRRLLPVAMRAKQKHQAVESAGERKCESGLPGGGEGRRDVSVRDHDSGSAE